MKKVLMVGLALLVSVAFVTAVFAQAPAKPAEKHAPSAEGPGSGEEGSWRLSLRCRPKGPRRRRWSSSP